MRSLLVGLIVPCLVLVTLSVTRISTANNDKKPQPDSLMPIDDPNFPQEFDIRAIHGTPRGTDLPVPGLASPTALQLKGIESLKNTLGLLNTDKLRVDYNGLTATPRHIINRDGYLSSPSSLAPETIALNFISRNREIFRFSENDLNNLKLISRAKSDNGTTTMVFNQRLNGKPVYHGDVMVNVARNGQIVNVGGESYPRLTLANTASITPAQAIQLGAERVNVNGFTAQSLGSTQVLATFGNLPPEYVTGEKFSGGTTFGDDIIVTQVVFPMGSTARLAYKFTLTTPQYYGIMWQHFIDAQTGATLRRHSLTAFQSFGTPGGGFGVPRLGTFRPDIQNMVESFNHPNGTARGKVVDTVPTMLSGYLGFGRSTRSGTDPSNYIYTAPTYAADTGILPANAGRGFRFGQALGRYEFPLPWDNSLPRPTFNHSEVPAKLGQITRGFPDATNPSSASPFGWFYLPTGNGGAEITDPNANRTTTRALGYTMHPEAVTRNQSFAGNSPAGDGTQPFSADVTPLGAAVNLADGRVLSSVIQSRYTEGNNIMTSDDRNNDNETTQGIKGYAANRQFTAGYFDYVANYEYGGIDAAAGVFPPTTNIDVPPGTTALFYFNNVVHDYLYGIGFTEQFWNFQMDNFGKGGAGGDYVKTQVMDGSGVNNANMGTGDDGAPPRMQMYLFTESTFRRSDGSFDFDVVAHEQYHGVSNRSAGKGTSGCLGITLVGESGGMGEGWSDFIAASMSDDDVAGDFVTGQLDIGIRRLPMTNYRYSYGATDNRTLDVRRRDANVPTDTPDPATGTGNPFAVHSIGELWSATLWDMRELLIMKQKVNSTFPGIFFDGNRRLGGGASFFIGERQVQSVDAFHPINYRPEFNTTSINATTLKQSVPNILPEHFVRPGMVAQENASNPARNGPLATAVSRGAQLADQLTLRGLQLAPCNPSFVEMRDSMLAADREITGGENQALIWRSFASHGVGQQARSTGGTGGTDPSGGAQSAPIVVEDFSVPAGVTECETLGPLPAPAFALTNTNPNSVTVAITPVSGASSYVIARSENPNGPFTTIATVTGTTYEDNNNGEGLILNRTYYYQVHAARNPQCVGTANTQSITVTVGVPVESSPVFSGVGQVTDPRQGTTLVLNWSPATSASSNANIVYDIYRVTSVTRPTPAGGVTDSTTPPTFEPTAANRRAQGVTGTTFTDTGLITGQIYYYIVQARDVSNGKLDSNNTGNRVAKFSAPTTNTVSSTPFALESFEAASAETRFAPPLVPQPQPNNAIAAWQRVLTAEMLSERGSLVPSAVMFAPDFDPDPPQGAPSDFFTNIGPLTLSPSSILEFDSRFVTEFAFDGGVIELVLGTPGAPTTYPDNTTTFDLNYFLFENGYSGKLDGTLAGPVFLSPLQGRFGFTGTRDTSHVRAALGSFAPGAALNPNSEPVFIRFRMASDVGTSPGEGSGWYIDNLAVNNFGVPTAAGATLGGRITNANGVGLRDATVTLLNTTNGETRTTQTNGKGVYVFEGVAVGGNYVITPKFKRYSFTPSSELVSHVAERTDVDFTAEPQQQRKGR
ncbi:MAG TPA: M36 family metallopeptidase [Pyrinomonadaceae bacterium]|nr:M36 family metallopeptidase [Pyrinomonadaceae bacterium]